MQRGACVDKFIVSWWMSAHRMPISKSMSKFWRATQELKLDQYILCAFNILQQYYSLNIKKHPTDLIYCRITSFAHSYVFIFFVCVATDLCSVTVTYLFLLFIFIGYTTDTLERHCSILHMS